MSDLAPLEAILTGAQLSSKQWSVLVDAGLMPPALRIPGSMKYGIAQNNIDRLSRLLAARSQLGGRYTISGLAFEAARSGLDVPIELVKDELEIRLVHCFGFMKRTLQRSCALPSSREQITKSDLYHAADTQSKRLTKNMKRGQFLSRQFLKLTIGMLLRMLYLNEPVIDSSRNVREMILPLVSFEHKTLGAIGMSLVQAKELATQVSYLISSSRDVLTLDFSRNAMFINLRLIPESTFHSLFQSWPFVCEIFWDAYDRVGKVIVLPQWDESARDYHNLMILGVLVAGYDGKSPDQLIYSSIMSGNMEPLHDLLSSICSTIELGVEAQKAIRKSIGTAR